MAINFKVPHSRTSEYRLLPEDITINPELNGRVDKPEIEWLMVDMLAHGQHTPVVVRNDGGKAVLVAGFSRWRAVSEINRRQLSPIPMQLRCTAVTCNEMEAFIINISENRFRNPTTALDDAHNIKRLMKFGLTEDQIAAVYCPTAKTEQELRAAHKFINSRIAVIGLAPEVETEVRSGRVKESAVVAIAKLSQEQQREVIKKEGTIDRKDLVEPRAKKKIVPKDVELFRRIAVMFEDVSGMLNDPAFQEFDYLEVNRLHLLDLYNYVQEVKRLEAEAKAA